MGRDQVSAMEAFLEPGVFWRVPRRSGAVDPVANGQQTSVTRSALVEAADRSRSKSRARAGLSAVWPPPGIEPGSTA
jgi:hypothetical protein